MQTAQRKEGFVKRILKKSSNIRHFHHHRANKNTVTFHFKLEKPVEDYPGEVMLISGSIPELGNGSIANAARMYLQDSPEGRVWKYDLVVPVKELEHARMDIAGSYEGNPHGNFFTYNYVVKKPEEKGVPAIEKFEAVPRRGVPKSSLMTTNSLGEQVFLNEYTIDHTWSSTSTPSSVIVAKKELSSIDLLSSKADVTPEMRGKAATLDSAPMSPSRPRAASINTDVVPRLQEPSSASLKPIERSVSAANFSGISKKDQDILDQLKAQLDERDSKKKGMFSWYKNLKGNSQEETPERERAQSIYSPETERQQRYMREASAQLLQVESSPIVDNDSVTIVIEDPLPEIPQQNAVKSLSPEERRAEEQRIIDRQKSLRQSYDAYRSKSEEAREMNITGQSETFVVPEMVRIEDDDVATFTAPQLNTSDHVQLERDPLMSAVDPELKEEKFNFNASIEELEQKVIFNLKEAELNRTFAEETAFVENTSDEISEDVLLDRIEENTPLLAPEDSQLQDEEEEQYSDVSGLSRSGVINFSEYIEEPSEVSESRELPSGSVDPIMFGKIHRLNKEVLEEASRRSSPKEIPIQSAPVESSTQKSSSWTSSFGIDAVLSGKMYRIGQELKQKVFGESGWSNFLQAHQDLQSSIRSYEPVDPIVSGKLHNVHRELTSKVAGKSVEDRNDWLSTRRNSTMPAFEPVDPIVSGRLHNVHKELTSRIAGKSVEDRNDWLSARRNSTMPAFEPVDPIVSGRLHNVHKELTSKVAGKSTESRNEWLSTRRNSTTPASEPVDPVISGKMHKVHSQLKQKLPESGRLVDFFGFVPKSMSFSGINPIISGKMNKVHQQITSIIPRASAISISPALWNSGVPEITIKDESLKTMSVFEEQIEKELTHRRRATRDQDASSPINVGKVSTRDLKNVGFHTVRNDFMPISHSESMVAIDSSPLSVTLFNQNPPMTSLVIMISMFFWYLLYSFYFPVSTLASE